MEDEATRGLGFFLTLIVMAILAPVAFDLGRWIVTQIFETGTGYTGGMTLCGLALGYIFVSQAIGNTIAAFLT